MHIQVLLYTIIIERRHRVTTFDCHWKNIMISIETTNLVFCSGYNAPALFRNLQKWSLTCKELAFSITQPTMVRIINGQPLLRRHTDTLSWYALGSCVSLSLGILHQYPAWQLHDYYDMKRLNTDLIYIMAQCHFYKILIYAICLRYDIAKLLLKLAWSTSQSVKHSLYFMPLITNWYTLHDFRITYCTCCQY